MTGKELLNKYFKQDSKLSTFVSLDEMIDIELKKTRTKSLDINTNDKDSAIEACLDYLDELNSESSFVFDSDLYHNLCNARRELDELKYKYKKKTLPDSVGWWAHRFKSEDGFMETVWYYVYLDEEDENKPYIFRKPDYVLCEEFKHNTQYWFGGILFKD